MKTTTKSQHSLQGPARPDGVPCAGSWARRPDQTPRRPRGSPPTFLQQVGDVCLVAVSHSDLPLVGQERLLLRVVDQRVEEKVLGKSRRGGGQHTARGRAGPRQPRRQGQAHASAFYQQHPFENRSDKSS